MTRKIFLTKSGEFKAVKNTTVPGSGYDSIVHYRTIEVTNINPSVLTMKVRKITGITGTMVTPIPLVDFRTLFLKEDDKYILDVRGLSRFIDLDTSSDVQVSFDSIDENASFNVEVFYMLEDAATFEWHSNILAEEAAEF